MSLKNVNCPNRTLFASSSVSVELETAAPMRVFVVNFAKVALRIYEMRDKLAEARRINKQLQVWLSFLSSQYR